MSVKSPSIIIGFNKFRERRNPDRLPIDIYLLGSVIALLCVGLVMMTSASISEAERLHNEPFYFFKKQSLYILVGLCAGAIAWKIPLKTLNSLRPLLLLAAVLMLAILLIPGVGQNVNGSTRWIRMASINFQVSELVKLFVILFFAGYLQKQHFRFQESSKPVIVPLIILALLSVLLLMQPDFGATVVICVTTMAMLLLAGVKLQVFAGLVLLAGSLFAALIYFEPYRMIRVLGFLDP